MGIIRLSVSLFDFEDRAQSMETLELVVFIITKVFTFNLLFQLAVEVDINFKLLMGNTVIAFIAVSIGIIRLMGLAETPNEILEVMSENAGWLLYLLTFFLLFTLFSKSI